MSNDLERDVFLAIERRDVIPAIRRPGMYAGEQGDRTEDEWKADAVVAYLNHKLQHNWRDMTWPLGR